MSEKAIDIGGDHVAGIARPILSVAPVSLPVAGRGTVLQLRISAPLDGVALPIILFSHGNGQSLHAYGPLVNHWAAQGFVVIQPTHLDSRMLGLAQDDPRRPQLWRHRENDLVQILDALPSLLAAVPALSDRVDRDRIAVAGHSWGAQTASMLLGARHPDPDDGSVVDIRDERVKAGILLTIPGTGGANLSPFAAQRFPFMHPDFSAMTAPSLIIAGDADRGAMTVRGPEWWREAYDLSPAPKALFTLHGGEHSLGGIPNYEARETTDERPRRVAAIGRPSVPSAATGAVGKGCIEAWSPRVLTPGRPAAAAAPAASTATPMPGHGWRRRCATSRGSGARSAAAAGPCEMQSLLAHPLIGWLALLALCAAYIQGGLTKLLDFPGAVAEATSFGLPLPPLVVALTIVLELGASALILTGHWRWAAALALAAFTLAGSLIANRFWERPPGRERAMTTNAFFEHLGLIGAFVFVARADILGEAR